MLFLRFSSHMKSLRSHRSTYVAAFLLGAVIALLAARPARSAEPFRLDRVGVVRFTAEENGMLRRQAGVLLINGDVLPRASSVVARPANTPDWALNRNLVSVAAWQGYHALGTGALWNFTLAEGGVRIVVGDEHFLAVQPDPAAQPAAGRVINLSAQVKVTAGGAGVAGFVIDEQPRAVLIRAVGPTLRKFGIGAPLSDTFLSIRLNGRTLHFNDNWNDASEAAAIRNAAQRVGAFPLDEGAGDSARLVILPPGAYSAVVEAAHSGASGSEVLLEIYSVPAELVDISPAAVFP